MVKVGFLESSYGYAGCWALGCIEGPSFVGRVSMVAPLLLRGGTGYNKSTFFNFLMVKKSVLAKEKARTLHTVSRSTEKNV